MSAQQRRARALRPRNGERWFKFHLGYIHACMLTQALLAAVRRDRLGASVHHPQRIRRDAESPLHKSIFTTCDGPVRILSHLHADIL
jgi:hypothetical protein